MPYKLNPFTGDFDFWSNGPGIDHGLLSGLLDDDHAQYFLLAGRPGQTAFLDSGTGANGHLYGTAGAFGALSLAGSSTSTPTPNDTINWWPNLTTFVGAWALNTFNQDVALDGSGFGLDWEFLHWTGTYRVVDDTAGTSNKFFHMNPTFKNNPGDPHTNGHLWLTFNDAPFIKADGAAFSTTVKAYQHQPVLQTAGGGFLTITELTSFLSTPSAFPLGSHVNLYRGFLVDPFLDEADTMVAYDIGSLFAQPGVGVNTLTNPAMSLRNPSTFAFMSHAGPIAAGHASGPAAVLGARGDFGVFMQVVDLPSSPANDVDLGDSVMGQSFSNILITSAGGPTDLTGIVIKPDPMVVSNNGKMLWISNVSGQVITFKNEDVGSVAENRFKLPGGLDLILNQDNAAQFTYLQAPFNRWFCTAIAVDQPTFASAHITGKLTVDGVIDPTMVLLTGADKRFGATDAGTVYLAPFVDAIDAVEIRKADNTTVFFRADTINDLFYIEGNVIAEGIQHVFGEMDSNVDVIIGNFGNTLGAVNLFLAGGATTTPAQVSLGIGGSTGAAWSISLADTHFDYQGTLRFRDAVGVTDFASFGPDGKVHHTLHNAATTTADTVMEIAHHSSGTPAAGFGSTYDLLADSASVVDRLLARVSARWTTATDASRESRLGFSVIDNHTGTPTLVEVLTMDQNSIVMGRTLDQILFNLVNGTLFLGTGSGASGPTTLQVSDGLGATDRGIVALFSNNDFVPPAFTMTGDASGTPKQLLQIIGRVGGQQTFDGRHGFQFNGDASSVSIVDDDLTFAEVARFGINVTPTAYLHAEGAIPPSVAGNGADGRDILLLTGPKGGDTSGTTGQTAGKGSDASITTGDGGDAPGGSTNGNGGDITFQTGVGGAGAGGAGTPGNIYLNPTNGKVAIGDTTPPNSKLRVKEVLGSSVLRIQSSSPSGSEPYLDTFHGRVLTTNNTVTTLMSYTLAASETTFIEARVVGRRTGGSAGTAEDGIAVVVRGGYKMVAGVATALTNGTPATDFESDDQAAWTATLDTTGATVRVRVTGATNNNITWHCTLMVQSVGT